MARTSETFTAAGLQRTVRIPNRLEDKVERRDPFFPKLTVIAFRNPAGFERIYRKIAGAMEKPDSEFVWALKGYFAYLHEDYRLASECFSEAVVLSPENYDNWADLAFALRHVGRYEASERILFDPGGMAGAIAGCQAGIRRFKLQELLGKPTKKP